MFNFFSIHKSGFDSVFHMHVYFLFRTLQGSDTVNSFSVYGQEVDVVASKPISTGILSQPTTGSNKVVWNHKKTKHSEQVYNFGVFPFFFHITNQTTI